MDEVGRKLSAFKLEAGDEATLMKNEVVLSYDTTNNWWRPNSILLQSAGFSQTISSLRKTQGVRAQGIISIQT